MTLLIRSSVCRSSMCLCLSTRATPQGDFQTDYICVLSLNLFLGWNEVLLNLVQSKLFTVETSVPSGVTESLVYRTVYVRTWKIPPSSPSQWRTPSSEPRKLFALPTEMQSDRSATADTKAVCQQTYTTLQWYTFPEPKLSPLKPISSNRGHCTHPKEVY